MQDALPNFFDFRFSDNEMGIPGLLKEINRKTGGKKN